MGGLKEVAEGVGGTAWMGDGGAADYTLAVRGKRK